MMQAGGRRLNEPLDVEEEDHSMPPRKRLRKAVSISSDDSAAREENTPGSQEAEFQRSKHEATRLMYRLQAIAESWTVDQRAIFRREVPPELDKMADGMVNSQNCFAKLPGEIFLNILGRLDIKSLLTAERVCHAWHGFINQQTLWRTQYEKNDWPAPRALPEGRGAWKRKFFETKQLYEQARRNWESGVYVKHVINANSNGVYCLQYDEDKVVCGSRDNCIHIWDLPSLTLRTSLAGHVGSVLCLQYDEHKVVSGSSDATIKWWDLATGECLATFTYHKSSVLHLQYDDRMLVSCSKDNSIVVWHVDPTRPNHMHVVDELKGHTAPVNVVQFDNHFIVSASGDKTIRVWDRHTRAHLRTLEGHGRGIACLHFRKNLVVSGSSDNSIKLWNVHTGQCIRSIDMAHSDLVRCIRMDDNYIVSGSYDTTIKLWDLARGWMIRSFSGHEHRVFKLQFDRLSMVSCSHDDKLIVWDFRPQAIQNQVDAAVVAVEEEEGDIIG